MMLANFVMAVFGEPYFSFVSFVLAIASIFCTGLGLVYMFTLLPEKQVK